MSNNQKKPARKAHPIDYQLEDANLLKLGMECQPKEENGGIGSVRCMRNWPKTHINVVFDYFIQGTKPDKKTAPIIYYYCKESNNEVPADVQAVMDNDDVSQLTKGDADYIASPFGIFPSMKKVDKFIDYYDELTGENLVEELWKYNKHLPAFFAKEEKEDEERKNGSQSSDNATSTKATTKARGSRQVRTRRKRKDDTAEYKSVVNKRRQKLGVTNDVDATAISTKDTSDDEEGKSGPRGTKMQPSSNAMMTQLAQQMSQFLGQSNPQLIPIAVNQGNGQGVAMAPTNAQPFLFPMQQMPQSANAQVGPHFPPVFNMNGIPFTTNASVATGNTVNGETQTNDGSSEGAAQNMPQNGAIGNGQTPTGFFFYRTG